MAAKRGEHGAPHFGVFAAQIIVSQGFGTGASNGGIQAGQAALKGGLPSRPGALARRRATPHGARSALRGEWGVERSGRGFCPCPFEQPAR
jgi:hypothetical protein